MLDSKSPAVNKLISDYHVQHIKKIAHQLTSRLPASIDEDDLLQVGILSLLDLQKKGKIPSSRELDATTEQRIRNAMLDEMRIFDDSPSSVRQNKRKIEAALSTLQQQYGHLPSEQELAKKLEIPLSELQQMLSDNARHQTVYFEDLNDEDLDQSFLDRFYGTETDSPLEDTLNQDLQTNLQKIIDLLPEQEHLLMWLYYDQELTTREIATILGQEETAVADLLEQLMQKIRQQFGSQ
jgi:RNA polymerase sigma factor for flagellar operon FliA